MMISLNEILETTGAELIKGKNLDRKFSISTDTRTIKPGELYLPLKGASFDGENFLQQAINSGAEGCFITRNEFPQNAEFVLKVNNSLVAYMKIANRIRKNFSPKTIAVTGSSGKTTTKEIINSVLSEKFKTHKTFSNHNNEIGFCETIMTMPENTEVLIIEMGMRGLGEIELLSRYSEPDYAVITNAGSAHIGRLGSLDNIAKAKSEVVSHLNTDGLFLSQNNPRIKKFVEYSGKTIYYSLDDIKIVERAPSLSTFIYKGNEYKLQVEGDYNIENSIPAIELGYTLGMTYDEIKKGLYAYRPIEKRWEARQVNGFTIINDSYNANPESMKASVSTFLQLYSKPLVILGDMGELGDFSSELHREVGEYLHSISESKNAVFLTVGEHAKEIGNVLKHSVPCVKNFENNEQVSKYILDNVDAGTTIFLKASRSMKFEEIIDEIQEGVEV